MKRVEHRGEHGALASVELTRRDTSDVSDAIEIQSAPPALMRITSRGEPLLWARVTEDHAGWDIAFAPRAARAWWPVVRADDTRRLARANDWVSAWVEHWSQPIGRVAARTRGRIDVVPFGGATPHRYLEVPTRSTKLLPREPGFVSWNGPGRVPLVALRDVPDEDDARVKAYRKQARDGTLAPVVLRWVSGLMTHLMIDGHARWVAARLERVLPRMLAIVPVHVDRENARAWSARAVDALDTLIATRSAGSQQAVDALNRSAIASARSAWRAIERARPIPGAARAWRDEVARLPDGPSRRAMLMPFDAPKRTGFVWW